MKIQSDGKGYGKPVTGIPEYTQFCIAQDIEYYKNPAWEQFDRDNPTLPIYLPNGEPYLKDDVVEGEKIDQLFSFAVGWVDENKVTDLTKYIREKRRIYRVHPVVTEQAEVKTGVWLDAESKDYANIDASRLVVKFEDGSTIMYNQDNWPKLIVTHILILPL